ncbi:MAG: hypothetical protein ACJ79X_12595 [Gemmatimonadaceae bacterium]
MKVSGLLTLCRECLYRIRVSRGQPRTLGIEPALEFRSVTDVKTLQQIAAIESDRLRDAVRVERVLERGGVTPEVRPIERHTVAIAVHDRFSANGTAEEVDRLPERVAGAIGIELRPEER